jgi:hypothetical protein
MFLFVLLFSACSSNAETQLPQTQEPSPTTIVLPTDTPTPLAPVGVFLTPDGSDPALAEELNTLIGSYLREEGLRYQVLNSLVEDDFDREDYRIVVVLSPYPDLAVLAEDHPDTKFLAVGFNDIEPGSNLSVLQSGGEAFDVQGFIAGYIAAMITTDWRVGALSLQDNEDALAAREGFQVGVKYYCGLCNPKYAPMGINYIYPKFIDLPVDATEEQVNANLDFLVDRAVNTFYIAPGVGTQNIYRTLVGYQKWIIGSGSDFQEEYKDYWVVSLEYDLVTSLQEVWLNFISAETGFVEAPPLQLTDINYDLISEGKVNLVYQILEDVSSGYIRTSFVE